MRSTRSIGLVLAVCVGAAPLDAEVTAAFTQERPRATLEFLDGRTYTGRLSTSEEGDLTLDSAKLGGPAPVDFRAVESVVVRGLEVPGPPADDDVLTAVRSQRFYGEVLGIDGESIRFRSESFGEIVVPRSDAGDLTPPGRELAENSDGARISAAWDAWSLEGVEESAGVLHFERRGARIARSLDLVGKSLSVMVEWLGTPEFALRIGESSEDDPMLGQMVRPWRRTLTLSSFDGETLEYVRTEGELATGGRAVLHLSFLEDAVRFDAVELDSSRRVEVGDSVPWAPNPDGPSTLSIEALGRPMKVVFADFRDPNRPLDEDGMLTLERTIRGSEVSAFDSDERRIDVEEGPVAFDRSRGVAFMVRDEREQLVESEPKPGRGRFSARNGESIEVSQVLVRDGKFILRSPYSPAPITVDVLEVHTVLAEPKAQGGGSTGSFLMSIDDSRPTVSGFLGVEVDGEELSVLRSEPGFKRSVKAKVAGRLRIERATKSLFYVSNRTHPQDVLLADGQLFPANVTGANADTVTFEVPFVPDPLVVPQSEIKAVIFVNSSRAGKLLAPVMRPEPVPVNNNRQGFFVGRGQEVRGPDPGTLTKKTLGRALAVPRSQKSDPGTHLLIATNGDLLRTNVVGLTPSKLLVEGGSGGAMEIPLTTLAMWVFVASEGTDDPRAIKIKTRRSDDSMTVDLGKRALLRGTLVGGDAESLEIDHALIGTFRLALDEIKSLVLGEAFEGRMKPVLDWHTTPMPEPNIQGN